MEQISIKTINHFFSSNNLSPKKILVGVSGGVDSMVLLHLLNQLPITIAVAHCNFGLRGFEADGDEALVTKYCNEKEIQLFTKRFETTQYASSNGISIEMAARDLRYAWFEELLQESGAEYLAIAHNLNDSIETFFLNLSRGSGIKGLTGISPINGRIIRPLITVSREQIEDYAKQNQVAWRTDATNLTDIYRRNFIRHKILPLFSELNPSFLATMQRNLTILDEVNSIFEEHTTETVANILVKQGAIHYIDIEKLTSKTGWKVLLFEMLNRFGFSSGEFEMAKRLVSAQTGSRIVSDNYTLWKNRDKLVIEPNASITESETIISSNEGAIAIPIKLQWNRLELNGTENSWQPNQGVFEPDKLTFPLIIRSWRPGDSFVPSGMKGSKKVSDFLTDQKVESNNRASILVMESGGKIAWVIGLRVSEMFRKKGNTGAAIIFNLD